MPFKIIAIIFSLFLCVAMQPAMAADEKKEEPPQKTEKEKQKEIIEKLPEPPKKQKSTPLSKWIAEEKKIMDSLSKDQQETYAIIRNKHGIVRTVRIVERDVGNAVKACGKENPDLKEEMTARFDQWRSAVDPILKTSEKLLKEEVKTQKVLSPKKFWRVLKLNDDAYKYQESQIEKRPVTTEKACKSLLKSMDRTEDTMVKLLTEILLPEAVIKQRLKQQNKEKADG